MRWVIELETQEDEGEVRSIFEFVNDLATVEIECDAAEHSDAAGFPAFDASDQSAEVPHEASNVDAQPHPPSGVPVSPDRGTVMDVANAERSAVADRIDTAERTAQNVVEPVTQNRQPLATTPAAPSAPATIRVNLDRVDRLINLIGELVIMESMLAQAIETAGLSSESDVSNGLDGIKQLASGIQESVMAIRAQPLKPLFQRMHRIIREAGDATGKKVRLVTVGETTEVDKTVIERLVDPLTHMIRNSVDHGLEDAKSRLSAGKPEIGTITLSAAHRSGRVIIEITDDGGGIDREKVCRIAEAKGLVPVGANLSPPEVDNLLFLPGFSSKDEVSALSGRGVGLDVVRREIQSLGGRVTIQSIAGQGTTFSIALPLTLAVLEGMLVEFSNEMMVLPLSSIVETLRPASATIHNIGRTGRVLANRGELIPIIDLAETFGVATSDRNTVRDVLLLVESEAGRRAALAVDLIHDQRQVVIKSLEENYGTVSGISAATILGNGRIALIVDPEEIIEAAGLDSAHSIAANE
jgi:two-component system chemotaxis sensor kinase CheA